jgi:hypothetical protein
VGWSLGDAGCQRNPESGFLAIFQCFLAIRDACCGFTPLNAGLYGNTENKLTTETSFLSSLLIMYSQPFSFFCSGGRSEGEGQACAEGYPRQTYEALRQGLISDPTGVRVFLEKLLVLLSACLLHVFILNCVFFRCIMNCVKAVSSFVLKLLDYVSFGSFVGFINVKSRP